MKVHPAAELFPMMPDDELAELAADIAENGLRQPIVIQTLAPTDDDPDPEPMLIDGRNRLAACKLAKVKPTYVELNGADAKAFIVSANVHRRHISQSQRIMAVAMIWPEPVAYKRGAKERSDTRANSLETKELPSGELSKARAILRHSESEARTVLAGLKTIGAAYKEAQIAAGKVDNEAGRLRKLAKARADLAAAVTEGGMTLKEAEDKAKADADTLKQSRWAATVNLMEGCAFLGKRPDEAAEYADLIDPAIIEQKGGDLSPETFRKAAAFATAMADELEWRAGNGEAQ